MCSFFIYLFIFVFLFFQNSANDNDIDNRVRVRSGRFHRCGRVGTRGPELMVVVAVVHMLFQE